MFLDITIGARLDGTAQTTLDTALGINHGGLCELQWWGRETTLQF